MSLPGTVWNDLGEVYRGLARCSVKVSREVLRDAIAVGERLAALGGDGWVCTTSQVAVIRGGKGWPAGPVLSAELVLDEARSVHVRYDDQGWVLVTFEEVGAEGDDVLATTQRFVSYEERGTMIYRVYHRLEETAGVRVYTPHVARLIGFEAGERGKP